MIKGTCVLLALALAIALSAPATVAEEITVGVLHLASSGPIFIAADKGYFKDEGLEAKLVFFEAAQPIAVAVVSRDLDVGVTAFTAGFFSLAGKGGITVIGAQSREEPGYHLIAYVASDKAYDAGFKSLKDFPGKKIAITQVGSSFHYSLGLLADKLGFKLSSVELAPLQSMPNMASALEGNQVDGALMPASLAIPLIERGKAHLLGWVGDETPWQLGALFTSPKEVAEHRARLERFVRAFDDGKRHPSRSRKSVVIPSLAVMQPDQHVTRTNQVGIALRRQALGTRELGFEVLTDPDNGLRSAPTRTAIAVLSASRWVGGDVAQLPASS